MSLLTVFSACVVIGVILGGAYVVLWFLCEAMKLYVWLKRGYLDYPGYEETGIPLDEWRLLSEDEREKIRRVCS
jgi:hypothetical protein